MTLSFRPLTKADEPFLWSALYHAIYVPEGTSPPPRDIIEDPALTQYVAQWMMRDGDIGVLAMIDQQPIGAAWLRSWTPPRCGFGFIDPNTPELSISLTPGHRGQGIGTSLLGRLFDMAKPRYNAISLSVSEDNPARALYERFGFKVYGETKDGSVTMRLSPIP